MTDETLNNLCDLSPFVTGPSATTELHAGGVFFCVMYRRELIFHPNRQVDLNFIVLDNWRPLDDEAQSLSSQSCIGKLTENSRGYVEIAFPSMTFTGSECDNLSGHIAFHIYGEIEYDADVEKLMGGDVGDLPRDFTESVVFFSNVLDRAG